MDVENLGKLKTGELSKILSRKFQQKIRVKSFEFLGEGFHGKAFRISTICGKSFVLKQFKDSGRNLDFVEDRIRESLLINRTSNLIDSHISVFDTFYLNDDFRLLNFPKKTPIILMEEVQGDEYFEDLAKISKQEELSDDDVFRIKEIAKFLANLKFNKKSDSTYHRYLKDWFSSGILELLNELRDDFSDEDLFDLKVKFLKHEHYLSSLNGRCSMIHGEFFPGTIHFDSNSNMKTYDMRRIGEGEIGDDVGSILFNFYAFSIQSFGKITPIFEKCADIFLEEYLKLSEDEAIFEVLPVFMAYRNLILVNKNLIPMDDEKRDVLRNFLLDIVNLDKFDKEVLNKYK